MKKDKLKNESNNANVLLCVDNFTGYFDDANKPIFVSDKLKSEWNYEVIVVKNEDGGYSGKLICDDNHSCKNIPYALNKGKGYIKLFAHNDCTKETCFQPENPQQSLPPFHIRLIEEQKELEIKIKKLSDFLKSKEFSSIPLNQKIFMELQLFTMKSYNTCLLGRIYLLNH